MRPSKAESESYLYGLSFLFKSALSLCLGRRAMGLGLLMRGCAF
jgi:hypothetical protein